MKRIIIAGVSSGVGKTTIAMGVMASFAQRMAVQGFKAGPDYIDPSYHACATGRPSRNLDTWLLTPDAISELFLRGASGAEVAVIEGVMGLFDGRSGEDDAGSTAHLAKLLAAPVVLVVDAAKIARSAAAIVLGFRLFDPALNLAGVILNRIAGPRHYEMVAGPIEREAGVPVLGYLPRDPELAMPERYLGLIPTAEIAVGAGYLQCLAGVCQRHIDLNRLEAIASAAPALHPLTSDERLFPAQDVPRSTVIAVARDTAFSFYYQDNLDLLRAWGAEVVEFSPLANEALPDGTAGLYLGGGFPELYASELAVSDRTMADLRRAAAVGMPIYGECGGLMYLGTHMTDSVGREHAMVGLIPARTAVTANRLSIGYRELRALRDAPLLDAGRTVRAHEFHYSGLVEEPASDVAAYEVGEPARQEGFSIGSITASYMHIHFGSHPALAPHFVKAARLWRESRANA